METSDYVGIGLAVAYGLVALAIIISHAAGRLPRTRTVTGLLVCVVLACILRGVYLTGSLTYLQEIQASDDESTFGHGWWILELHWSIFILSNVFLLAHYVQLAKLWSEALAVLHNTSNARTIARLNKLLAIYVFWELLVCVTPAVWSHGTNVIIFSSTHLCIQILITVFFFRWWLRLWSAIRPVTLHRTYMEACCEFRHAFVCCTRARPEHEHALPLAGSSQLPNILSARQKLRRFTSLASAYALSSLAKVGFSGWQINNAVLINEGGSFPADWWKVTLANYTVTELALFVALIAILWKSPSPSSSSGAGAVNGGVGQYGKLRAAQMSLASNMGAYAPPVSVPAGAYMNRPSSGVGLSATAGYPSMYYASGTAVPDFR